MTEPRKPDAATGEQVGEQETAPKSIERTSTGKTLQELERIQFDALDRAGFDRG